MRRIGGGVAPKCRRREKLARVGSRHAARRRTRWIAAARPPNASVAFAAVMPIGAPKRFTAHTALNDAGGRSGDGEVVTAEVKIHLTLRDLLIGGIDTGAFAPGYEAWAAGSRKQSLTSA